MSNRLVAVRRLSRLEKNIASNDKITPLINIVWSYVNHQRFLRLGSYLKYAAKTRIWLTFPKTQITSRRMAVAN